MSSVYNSKINLEKNYTIFFLGLLIFAGLIIRLLIFPYDIPITEDGAVYFWYALDMSITNSFPENYNFPNNGWPSFLSLIFDVVKFDNYLDYMNTQRITTAVISLITIIAVYHLCTYFFNKNYSLIGAAIFAFEPRLVLDSLLGTNMVPFVLLFTLTLSFSLSKNHKMILLSFVFASLATLVRYEGILLLIPLSIIYLIRFKKERKVILRYLLMIAIFVLILTPMAYVRYQTSGNDGITSHIIGGLEFFVGSESYVDTFPKNNILGGEPTKNRNFSGYIDEVSIWNKQLSDLDILALYNHSNPTLEKLNSHDGLITYLPFDRISEKLESGNTKFFIQSSCLEIISDYCKISDSSSSTLELTTGIKGNSMKFDGTNFLKFDDYTFPFSNSARSISMWILPISSLYDGNLLYHSGVWQNEKVFEINTNLWGNGSISVGILSDDVYSNPKILNHNEWNHIVVTFQGDKLFTTETVKIYHNGILLETNTAAEGILLNGDNDVQINTTPYFGLDLLGKYLAWISFPIFFVFLPYGLIMFFRKLNYDKYTVLLFALILTLPAFYAYFREFQEIKYLFYLFPIFALLSVFSIRDISKKLPKPNLLCILILTPIIISSIAFIEIKKIDNEFENEAFEIAKIVLEKANGINESTYHISKYAPAAESFLEDKIIPQKDFFVLQRLGPFSSEGLSEYLLNSKESGLTHLVIDESTEPDFLREIFFNENKYEFLTKEFDSAELNFKYHVKIFRIDYAKLQT